MKRCDICELQRIGKQTIFNTVIENELQRFGGNVRIASKDFAGIFLKVVAFLGLSLLISLSISSNDTFWNLKGAAF